MADDPFVFMIEDCEISSSQEEILRDCPLLGQPVNSPGDGVTSNLPKIAQDAGEDGVYRDFFITPPEEQSYFRPCVCHKAVQTDDGCMTQGFDYFTRCADGAMCVDLGDDSDLRFSLDEFNSITDTTMVAGCSFWNDGARVFDNSNGEIDKFRVSGGELSPNDGIGEPRLKRRKASEQNPGFKSSQSCSGIEPQKIRDDLQNCEAELVSNQRSPCTSASDLRPQQDIQLGINKENDIAETSADKNLGSGENLGGHFPQSEIIRSIQECVENIESKEQNCEELVDTDKRNKKVNEIAETSDKKGSSELQRLRIIAERVKDMTKGKNEDEKAVSFVFDVFKALTVEDSQKEDSLELENVSFLELARSRGFIFPTPWWWMNTNT